MNPRSKSFVLAVNYLFLILAPAGGLAQEIIPNLVVTIGTTLRDSTGQDWSYLFWDTVDSQSVVGKQYAVMGKTGLPDGPGTFSQRGVIGAGVDPASFPSLISKAQALGGDTRSLESMLNLLLRKLPGGTNGSLADKIIRAGQSKDPLTAEAMQLLLRAHPAVALVLGHGFAEVISGPTTYELREMNPTTGTPGAVVGRVTVAPGAPVRLPAPGKPYQVATNHPSDHLTIKLRWGTTEELRRLSLLQFGYNVYRLPKATAEASGFHTTAPALSQLLAQPETIKINAAAIMTRVELLDGSGPGGAGDPSDNTTYFVADDNRTVIPSNPLFVDGAEYYYFVTARDILGRDGDVSVAGLGQACWKRPPPAPIEVRVLNTVKAKSSPATSTPLDQRLQVVWSQGGTPDNSPTEYWIYRWINPAGAFTNDAVHFSNRIGVVSFQTNAAEGVFTDESEGSPSTPGPDSYAYTVRAVRQGACEPVLSPHSPPAIGVLRQREGPAAVTGSILGSCGLAVATFSSATKTNLNGLEWSREHYRLRCQRRDAGISWVRFRVKQGDTWGEAVGPIFYPAADAWLYIDHSLPLRSDGPVVEVECVVGTYSGQTSAPVIHQVQERPVQDQRLDIDFYAAQVLLTAMKSDDPLLAAAGIVPRQRCLPANRVRVSRDGTVSMIFDTSERWPMLIRAGHHGAWTDVGVAVPDTNGIYSISYPECVYGPQPEFEGCSVRVPVDQDCGHVVQTAETGTKAPIQVRFQVTSRSREYRLFRQVNDGPVTMISQGAIDPNSAQAFSGLVKNDDASPAAGARVCYFVQVLDEHGNPSPMASLGCTSILPLTLPTPVLAEPQPAGDRQNPMVSLSWFCPPAGVDRFRIWIRQKNPTKTTSDSIAHLKLRRDVLLRPALFSGLVPDRFKLITFDEAYLTPPLGTNFGPGPDFNMDIQVQANVPYLISVTAVDRRGTNSPPSQAYEFTWTQPYQPGQVPWPARPLPPLRLFTELLNVPADPDLRVRAVAFTNRTGQLLDPRYPVAIRIGILPNDLEPFDTVGTTNFIRYLNSFDFNSDPNAYLFTRISTNHNDAGELLLPIILYRHQTTNASFPRVSGDLVQVSPLIESIPWRRITDGSHIEIPDRLIACYAEQFTGRIFNPSLFLRDLQPVLYGASYRYFVVRFKTNREIDHIIPAGEVTIPNP